MKLPNIKKSLSFLMMFLTIFSSLCGLSCTEVNAAPPKSEQKISTVSENEILFTSKDMDDLITHFESILRAGTESAKFPFESSLNSFAFKALFEFRDFLKTKAANEIPNFRNLLEISEDAESWFECMRIYIKCVEKILKKDLSENVKKEIIKIYSNNDLVIGNMLNEIRKVMYDKSCYDIKKAKYLIIIVKFLKTVKLGHADGPADEKLKRFINARNDLLKIFKSTYKIDCSETTNFIDHAMKNMNKAIETLSQARENASEPEIKTTAQIILDVVVAKRDLALAKINVRMIENKLLDEEKIISEELMEALENRDIATKMLDQAVEKMGMIEKNIPRKILLEGLEELA